MVGALRRLDARRPVLRSHRLAEYLRAMQIPIPPLARALPWLIALAMMSVAFSLGAQGPVTNGLAGSYVEAQELGRRDEADDATRDYHRTVLLPQFSQIYRAHLRECTASVPQPESTPFSFVAALGADGRVLRVWSDRSTNVYQCVRGRLLFDRFPAPPRAPFYLYIHMRFVSPPTTEAPGSR